LLIVHVLHEIMFGGVGAVALNLITQQEKNGLRTAVVSHPDDEAAFLSLAQARGLSTRFYPIERFRLSRPTLWGELSGRNLRRIAADFPGEQIILHLHNPIAAGLFSHLQRPMLLSIHTLMNVTGRLPRFLYLTALRRVHRRGGKLVGVSHAVAEDFMDKLHVDDVAHVLNGVEDLPAASGGHVPNNGRIHIGFASNLNELKGWKYLAEGFLALPDSLRARADLTLAGRVDPGDQPYLDSLLAANPDIRYAGYLPDARTSLVPDLDILLLPSRTEAQGMILLEAMQSRVAVCATAVGGIPEVVIHGETGLIIRRDAADIAEKLSLLISDEALRHRLAENGRKLYERKGSAEAMCQNYLEIYQSLL